MTFIKKKLLENIFCLRLRLNESLEQTLTNFDSLESDSDDENDDQEAEDDQNEDDVVNQILTIPRRNFGKRFDSTLCMILPNSFCIPPSSEKDTC